MCDTHLYQVRNLRIREDTAKYLYNLNENAPYYDPKSRSMRENPLAGVKGKEQQAAKFSGENFVRWGNMQNPAICYSHIGDNEEIVHYLDRVPQQKYQIECPNWRTDNYWIKSKAKIFLAKTETLIYKYDTTGH